jgi:hypothetical protein
MARPKKKPKTSLADRRGVFPPESCCNDWEMTLVQVPGRPGPVDLDELVDHLIERGVVGQARRNIAAEVHAGRVATPAGKWALLVSLPGQSWAYFLPGHRDDALPAELAQKAGLRVIHAGYSDFANATAFLCVEGDEVLARFESCGMEENGEIVEQYTGGLDGVFSQTRFTGSRFPKEWLRQFGHEGEVLEALAKEFDAFIPYIGAMGFGDTIQMTGFDDREFKPKDYLRIDLIGLGDARLEPSPADVRLRDAILAGDVDAIRAAAAEGADLRTVPVHGGTSLGLALGPRHDGKSRKDLVAVLLDLGADPNDPGGEQAIHALLGHLFEDEAELIEILDLLTARGADVNARGKELMSRTRSPLHIAAQRGWLAVAKFLVSKGADANATDMMGQTPRQTALAAAESIKDLGLGDDDARYAPMLQFLAGAEAGRADLDWSADAEGSARRERRRQREMKRAFAQIGEGFKALSRISGDDPSAEDLVDAITYAQPDEIHLKPSKAKWKSEADRAETAALLVAEGFEPIGRFAIPEMPKIRVEAYHHPCEHVDAVIYDAAGQSILDLVRRARDGTKLTVTNNTTPPETHFDLPTRRTVRLPRAPAAEVLQALRAEPEPTSGVDPVSPGEFVERFEGAYRQEIKARKREGRRKPR